MKLQKEMRCEDILQNIFWLLFRCIINTLIFIYSIFRIIDPAIVRNICPVGKSAVQHAWIEHGAGHLLKHYGLFISWVPISILRKFFENINIVFPLLPYYDVGRHLVNCLFQVVAMNLSPYPIETIIDISSHLFISSIN